MKVEFTPLFNRDLRKLIDVRIKTAVQTVIHEVEAAASLRDVRQVKHLAGQSGYYRIRVGTHRVGVKFDGDVVVFLRFGHRRDIYRNFPP